MNLRALTGPMLLNANVPDTDLPPLEEVKVTQVPVRSGRPKRRLNVAMQVLSAFMVTWPSEQSGSPLQPAKIESVSAVGVSVTSVFGV